MTTRSATKTISTVQRTTSAAACALGVAGAALFAHHAAAQTAGSHLKPGQSIEMIAPAAKITSTVHYQANIGLDCSETRCSGSFRRPGSHHRINITRISCVLTGPAGSTFTFGELRLDPPHASSVAQYLPVDFSSSDGSHTLNRAVDMQIEARDQLTVLLFLASGTAFSAACTVTGTLSTLG